MKDYIIKKDEKGKWINTSAMQEYMRNLPKNESYRITIEPTNERTLQQNKWIHAVLPAIRDGLQNIGYSEIKTTDDAKDFIKSLFFKKKVTNGIDEVEIVQGTSQTSKLDFSEKADEIIRWAAEYLGIDIAPPNEQLTAF